MSTISRVTANMLIIAAAVLIAIGWSRYYLRAPVMPKHVPSTSTAPKAAVGLPSLTEVKYIRGRAATNEDVRAGVAVFAQVSGGRSVGSPSKMRIPQYAIHTDPQGRRTPGIIVQAEYSPQLKKEVLGMLAQDGTQTAGLRSEFMLLGDKRPTN